MLSTIMYLTLFCMRIKNSLHMQAIPLRLAP
ncbi:Protein of unknown function [Bacillus mobilis]|nr:Protein of unknown function [Bacillus mobilis]